MVFANSSIDWPLIRLTMVTFPTHIQICSYEKVILKGYWDFSLFGAQKCGMLCLDFCLIDLYSDCVHVVWITFLALTDKPTLLLRCTKRFGEAMSSYAAFNGGSMLTIKLAHLATGLRFCNNDDITLWSFWRMNYWRIALKTANPSKYTNTPKMSGHMVYIYTHISSKQLAGFFRWYQQGGGSDKRK